jgi:hypothetical protein
VEAPLPNSILSELDHINHPKNDLKKKFSTFGRKRSPPLDFFS